MTGDEVEEGVTEDAGLTEEQGDEQASDARVAVQERMDRPVATLFSIA